jgi:hypothetical protein
LVIASCGPPFQMTPEGIHHKPTDIPVDTPVVEATRNCCTVQPSHISRGTLKFVAGKDLWGKFIGRSNGSPRIADEALVRGKILW